MKRVWRNLLSVLALGSVLAAGSVAFGAPRGNRNGNGRASRIATSSRAPSFYRAPARSTAARPAVSHPRPAAARPAPAARFARPAAARPAPAVRPARPAFARRAPARPAPVARFARPVPVRPAGWNARMVRPVFKPVVPTAHHHRYLARVRALRAAAYRFVQARSYSIAARQAELARLEAELAEMVANEAWLTSYDEYVELARLVIQLRASLGIYAPAPPAALAYLY